MLHRDDDFEQLDEAKSGYAGDLSSTAQRQRALEQQKQRALRKQQERRGSSGVVQSNRAFAGASRTINPSRARTFSVPKTIDPLEGDDDLDLKPAVKRTGYADNFRGSSRNVSGNYGGVYEAQFSRQSNFAEGEDRCHTGMRVANVKEEEKEQVIENERFSLPNEIVEESKEHNDTPKAHVESKTEQVLKKRGILTSFDPTSSSAQLEATEAKPRRRVAGSKTKTKTSAAKSSKSRSSKPISNSREPSEDEEVDDDEQHQTSRSRAARKIPAVPSVSDEEAEAIDESERPTQKLAKRKTTKREEEPRRSGRKERVPRKGKSPSPENNDSPSIVDENEQKSSGDEYDTIERPLSAAAKVAESHTFDLSDMRAFLTNPIPKSAGTVQCYIERNKSGSSKLFPEYSMFMKEGDRFLLAAKKRAKNRTSNYSISMDPKDLNKGSGNFLGKLRANFIGTEFSVFDHGVNPKNADPDSLHVGALPIREELGSILYASNVLGSRGPRKMKVAIPAVGKDGKRVASRPRNKSEELLTRFKDRDMTNIIELVNKPPRWNDHVGAYVLNFNGRVTMASVKNFQLICQDDEDSVILQFGRVGKDLFTTDLTWPLSPMQAFGICLSSFDSKLACE